MNLMRRLLVLMLLVACAKSKPISPAESPYPAGASASPPAAPSPSLTASCATICAKNVTCAGLAPAEAKPKQEECEKVCNSQGGGNPLAAEILPKAMAAVASKCGGVACDKFGDCYMDTLKAMQEELTGTPRSPAKAVPDETRRRVVELVCKIVADHPGRIPDLNAPNPSSEMIELKWRMEDIGDPSATAEIMKTAIATCGK